MTIENRKQRRINVGPDHTIQFKVGSQAFVGLALANLSTGGCCAKVPAPQAGALEAGTALHSLFIAHAQLPNVALQGRVAWVLGKQNTSPEAVALVGIQFLDANPLFLDTLAQHLEAIEPSEVS